MKQSNGTLLKHRERPSLCQCQFPRHVFIRDFTPVLFWPGVQAGKLCGHCWCVPAEQFQQGVGGEEQEEDKLRRKWAIPALEKAGEWGGRGEYLGHTPIPMQCTPQSRVSAFLQPNIVLLCPFGVKPPPGHHSSDFYPHRLDFHICFWMAKP